MTKKIKGIPYNDLFDRFINSKLTLTEYRNAVDRRIKMGIPAKNVDNLLITLLQGFCGS